MSGQQIKAAMEALLASDAGVQGCALVDASSGLVWHHSGASFGPAPLWEAAVDYWRLQQRLQTNFEALGGLRAAVLHHRHGVLVVLPCVREHELLLVTVARHGQVNWRQWQRGVKELGTLVRQQL